MAREITSKEEFNAFWSLEENKARARRYNITDVLSNENMGYAIWKYNEMLKSDPETVTWTKLNNELRDFLKDNCKPYRNDINMDNHKIVNAKYDYQDDTVITNRRIQELRNKFFIRAPINKTTSEIEIFMYSFGNLAIVEADFFGYDITPLIVDQTSDVITLHLTNNILYNQYTKKFFDKEDIFTTMYVKTDSKITMVPCSFTVDASKITFSLYVKDIKFDTQSKNEIQKLNLSYAVHHMI